MTEHQPLATLAADIHAAPPVRRHIAPRTFDLHPALFAITLGGYLAYIGVMAAAFMVPELAIPFAIFVVTIVAGFLVPALWARVDPPKPGVPQRWYEFMRDGLDTWSGHLSGPETVAQVLIMPAMLLIWGLAIAVIKLTVG